MEGRGRDLFQFTAPACAWRSEGAMGDPSQGSRGPLLTEHPVHTSPVTFNTSEYQIQVKGVFFS